MKAAVIQFKASTNKENNLKKIISFIAKAASKNATLCAFPEFMMFYTSSSQTPKKLASLAETINGNFVTTVAKAAKDNRIQVIGSFYEKSRKKDRVCQAPRLGAVDVRGVVQARRQSRRGLGAAVPGPSLLQRFRRRRCHRNHRAGRDPTRHVSGRRTHHRYRFGARTVGVWGIADTFELRLRADRGHRRAPAADVRGDGI